jgi:transposase
MSTSKPSNNYPPELRERAIRMVAEVRGEYTSDWAAAQSVADKLGIGTPQTVLNWVRKAQVDAGQRPGVTSAEAAELRRLRAEVKQLRLANDILKTHGVSPVMATSMPANAACDASARRIPIRATHGRVTCVVVTTCAITVFPPLAGMLREA